jgi:hypothetical protein
VEPATLTGPNGVGMAGSRPASALSQWSLVLRAMSSSPPRGTGEPLTVMVMDNGNATSRGALNVLYASVKLSCVVPALADAGGVIPETYDGKALRLANNREFRVRAGHLLSQP